MNILDRVEEVRKKSKIFQRYKYVAEESGVSYEWLTKFANGKIQNPTLMNVNKLDQFLRERDTVSTDHET